MENASDVLAPRRLVEELEALGGLLGFTAGLLRSPLTAPSYEYLRNLSFEDGDSRYDRFEAGLLAMASYCRDNDQEHALRETSDSFHRMFVGPHHLPCPPWGSVYLDGGRLFGPSALEVSKVFARYGFAIPEGKSEPSDHIAYELAFLGEMNALVAQAQEGDRRQLAAECRAFAVRYVSPWFGEFRESVSREDGTGFYRGLVECVSSLLEAEDELLGCVIGG